MKLKINRNKILTSHIITFPPPCIDEPIKNLALANIDGGSLIFWIKLENSLSKNLWSSRNGFSNFWKYSCKDCLTWLSSLI